MDFSSVLMPAGGFAIGKTFTFEAAHRLAGVGPEHKCSRLHGHSYSVELTLVASELAEPGFVTDFGDLRPFRDFLNTEFDHRDLTEILPFEPTAEIIAQVLAGWFIQNLQPRIPGRLAAVRVGETGRNWARLPY